VNCAGAGTPPVIFEAALGASSLSWSLVQPDVARVTATCAYDRAGLGWSEAGPSPRTAGRGADELRVLLRAAQIPPPVILAGHSFGALVVRIFAARYRDQVAGLVLIDPAHPEEWLEPGEHERRQIEKGARLCRHGATAARLGIARAVSMLIDLGALTPARALTGVVSRGAFTRADEQILAPLWKLPPEIRRPLRRFWTEPKFFQALGSHIDTICDSAREAHGAGLAALSDLPLAVIAAGTSSERRLALHAALAQSSPRGLLTIVSDSGHWVPLDAPSAVTRAITEMVERVRAAA